MSKILLVEDDRSISTVYKIKLEHHHHECLQAFDGLEALKVLENTLPDLILLDLKMPVMDGEKMLSILRARESLAHIPVIVLTNISREEAPKTLWHLGISGYFVKANHTPSQLIQIVEDTLS
jgi:chemosensory pili system protein ChpA (sensor histidine kinase/response regulator)